MQVTTSQKDYDQAIELKHGDKIQIKGVYGTVGSVEGYGKQYGDDAEKVQRALARAVKLGHDIAWANKRESAICGDKGYYERLHEEWANARIIALDAMLEIEGRFYTIKWMGGQYSDFVHFVPA